LLEKSVDPETNIETIVSKLVTKELVSKLVQTCQYDLEQYVGRVALHLEPYCDSPIELLFVSSLVATTSLGDMAMDRAGPMNRVPSFAEKPRLCERPGLLFAGSRARQWWRSVQLDDDRPQDDGTTADQNEFEQAQDVAASR
jgi:hypothetical protein